MAYTPELSDKSCCTLRRIAWFLNIPMTTTLEQIIVVIPALLDKGKVCESCRDKSRCADCAFKKNNNYKGNSLIKMLPERRNNQCPI
ncbi:MAG: hypothetical protein ABSC11_13005 [Smithella sp.]|jgi:hypothetical protein